MKDRFVDVLLLTIIRAYKHHGDKTPQQRLLAAREALFGEKLKPGRNSLDDELALFKITAEQRKPEVDRLRKALSKRWTAEQEAEMARKPLSVRAASEKFAPIAPDFRNFATDPNSKADRLRRKVREANFSSHDMAELESILHGTSREMESIWIILEELKILRVEADRSVWD